MKNYIPVSQVLTCFGIGILLILFVIQSGCKSMPPSIDAKFWAGDSQNDGITRAQDHETIPCKDSRFDEYVCQSYADLRKIYQTLLKCKQWSTSLDSEDMALLDYVLKQEEAKIQGTRNGSP